MISLKGYVNVFIMRKKKKQNSLNFLSNQNVFIFAFWINQKEET